MQRKLLVIINVDFDAYIQILIICSEFFKYFKGMGEKKQCVSCL
jgi:hypothetical protein